MCGTVSKTLLNLSRDVQVLSNTMSDRLFHESARVEFHIFKFHKTRLGSAEFHGAVLTQLSHFNSALLCKTFVAEQSYVSPFRHAGTCV